MSDVTIPADVAKAIAAALRANGYSDEPGSSWIALLEQRPRNLDEALCDAIGSTWDEDDLKGMVSAIKAVVKAHIEVIPIRSRNTFTDPNGETSWDNISRQDVLALLGEGAEPTYVEKRAAENRANCSACGASDAACTQRVVSGKRSCCSTCYSMDTHPPKARP